MRRLIHPTSVRRATTTSALLAKQRPASTVAPPRKRDAVSKRPKAAHQASANAANVDGKAAQKDEAVQPSNTAASLSSSSWVQNTLHYDAAKVQQLADVFTGAAIPPTAAAASVRGKRRGSSALRNIIEETLRQPSAVKGGTLQTKKTVTQARASRQRDEGASSRKEQSHTAMKPHSSVLKWTSALLASSSAAVARLVQEVVTVHTSPRQQISEAIIPSSPTQDGRTNDKDAEQHEALRALLSSSRVQWQLTTTASAAPELLATTATTSSCVDDVHRLCLLASALESAVKALGEPGETAMLSEMKQAIQDLKTTMSREYERLLHKLTVSLTDALRLHMSSNGDSREMRLDVLLSALLSLLHAKEKCGRNVQRMTAQETATDRLESKARQTFSGSSPEAEEMEQLCTCVSLLVSQWANTAATTTAPAQPPTTSDTTRTVALYAASASSLASQLLKMEARLRVGVAGQFTCGQGGFQSVISTLFLFCVVVVRVAAAMQIDAARSTVEAALQNDGSSTPTTAAVQHDRSTQVRDRTGLIHGSEAVHLISQAESLRDLLHPLPEASAQAAQSNRNYRSTSTALSVSLSMLWRYSTRVRAAEVKLRRSGRPANSEASVASNTPTATAAPLYVSAQSQFWERNSAHVALLLRCYYELVATSSELLPLVLGAASTAVDVDISWVLPFYSRVLRTGMNLQLDATLLSVAHLGLEAVEPRSPHTPLEKVVAARRKVRNGTQRSISMASQLPMSDSGATGTLPASTAAVAGEEAAQWAHVARLSGGVRVVCCEVLYRAVIDIITFCAQPSSSPAASARFFSKHYDRSSSSTSPAVALVQATARIFFCMPRLEYVLGLYTDAILSAEAAVEQSRRVHTACVGVFLWLRELSPSFSSNFKDLTKEQPVQEAAVSGGGRGGGEWLVCGTTMANAMEAAFFTTYVLHHWPSQAGATRQGSVSHTRHNSSSGTTTTADPLMRAWVVDGVAAPMFPAAVDSLLSRSTAQSYVAQALFLLQHNTASLLRHLRTTRRFHHFTGELYDKSGLMAEPALQRRHVASTLSVVFAYQKQPNFVWMPLSTVQGVLFEMAEFPQLLSTATTSAEKSVTALWELPGEVDGEQVEREDDRPAVKRFNSSSSSSSSSTREYPKVQVEGVTVTFARAHSYLVRRLHVVSGILREYRSLLQHSSASMALEGGEEASSPSSLLALSSDTLQASLSHNAAHAPDDEGHRRNNHRWAHQWATMLREDFTRLPAEMEGTPRPAAGVLRVLQRMELVMFDTHQHGLFISVVKSQQQYQAQRRRRHGGDEAVEGEAAHLTNASPSNATHVSDAAAPREGNDRQRETWEVVVSRASVRVPLGVSLNSSGHILRVQETVSAPATSADEHSSATRSEGVSTEEEGEIASPVAVALSNCSAGGLRGASAAVGRRVCAVDGVAVTSGREVAAQVRGKTVFTLTLES